MRIILAAAAALSLTALAACNQPASKEPAPEPATPTSTPAGPLPAEIAGVHLNQPLRAIGTEPFWAVELTKDALKLSRAGEPEVTSPGSAPVMAPGEATWSGTTADGKALKVVLTAGPCSDGMSDRTYPLTSQVEFDGQTLKGCAATVAELSPTGGGSGLVEDFY